MSDIEPDIDDDDGDAYGDDVGGGEKLMTNKFTIYSMTFTIFTQQISGFSRHKNKSATF